MANFGNMPAFNALCQWALAQGYRGLEIHRAQGEIERECAMPPTEEPAASPVPIDKRALGLAWARAQEMTVEQWASIYGEKFADRPSSPVEASTADAVDTEAWRTAFNKRHEFDVYPELFMSGLRNEFCAGWQAALKASAALAQPSAAAGEPVAQWQSKVLNPTLPECDVWLNISEEGANTVRAQYSHVYKLRALYERSGPPPQPVEQQGNGLQACEWHLDDEDAGVWESSCGETWGFVDGGPVENRMRFCHGCGKPISLRNSDSAASNKEKQP